MSRKYTKKKSSSYWKEDKPIRLAYNKNKDLINRTHPDIPGMSMNEYELFKAQVKQKIQSGQSVSSATKNVLVARQYNDNPAKGEAM